MRMMHNATWLPAARAKPTACRASRCPSDRWCGRSSGRTCAREAALARPNPSAAITLSSPTSEGWVRLVTLGVRGSSREWTRGGASLLHHELAHHPAVLVAQHVAVEHVRRVA